MHQSALPIGALTHQPNRPQLKSLRAHDPLFLWKGAATFDTFVQCFKGGEFLCFLKAGAAFIVANATVRFLDHHRLWRGSIGWRTATAFEAGLHVGKRFKLFSDRVAGA